MTEEIATEAARNTSDHIEAQIEPAVIGQGNAVKSMIRRHSSDPEWRSELEAIRDLVSVETQN
ncbi:MAG TPA: hypothetical protein VGH31_07795 [Acidimicrobiales bacterium]